MKNKNISTVITPFKFFIKSVREFPFLLGTMIFAECGQAISTIMLAEAIRRLIDSIETIDPNQNNSIWDVIYDPFSFFIIVILAICFFSRLSGGLMCFVAPYLKLKPREWLFDHLCKHSLDYFSSRFSGALGAKINEVSSSVVNATWQIVFMIFPLTITFSLTIYLMYKTHLYLGFLMSIWLAIYISLSFLLAFKQLKIIETLSDTRAKISGKIIDATRNVFAIKSFSQYEEEIKNLQNIMQEEVLSDYRHQIWREITNWKHFILAVFLLIYSMYISVELYENGDITLGQFSFVFTLLITMTNQARELAVGFRQFLEFIGQISDGVKTIMQHHFITDKKDAKKIEVKKGSLLFDNVSFSYPELSNHAVLKNFTLDIPVDQKIGLVGTSGAGKSTLINLLLRFYDVDKGQIRIDNQNITDVTQDSLRQQIAIIPQDTTLFHRSLIDNIRYGDLKATDQQVIEAAKKAHAHEFIKNLPKGYDTLVGERGVKLSGGQRQRIAIARAILKNAPILILDEATSALDSESEQLIQDSLKTLMKGKTVIAIAHRLSTISHLDRIIVLDKGKIVEDGKHVQLLKNKKGLYHKLWSMQSSGFIGEG